METVWKLFIGYTVLQVVGIITTVDAQCAGERLNLTSSATVDYLTSENYPATYSANSNCAWRLESTIPTGRLIISVQAMSIEGCQYDHLTIYTLDPNSKAAEPVITSTFELCKSNTMLGEVLVTDTGFFYFSFISDNTVQYSGFKIAHYVDDTAYQIDCGSTLDATLTAQLIQSKDAGNIYSNDYSCTYTISTTVESAYIRITILFMDIESNNQCTLDKLAVYDGDADSGTLVQNLCYRSKDGFTDSVDTVNKTATVVFTTNTDGQYYGYVFTYKAHVDAQGSSTCSASGVSLALNVGDSATIETPDYPTSYTEYMDCRWIVTGTAAYAFKITFESVFDIEHNTYCGYDYLAIYDGADTSTLMNKFCGDTAPTGTILTTTNVMLLVFHSDYSINAKGVKVKYELYDASHPNCLEVFTVYTVNTTIQTLESPNFPSSYDSNTDVYYLLRNINTTYFNKIVINFKYIYIERSTGCIYDRLIIYNGGCPSLGVGYTLCGTREQLFEIDVSSASFGGDLLLHFHSDNSLNYKGFQVEYYVTSTLTTVTTEATTVTFGPPVQVVIDLMDEVLTNYTAENLPLRDLSQFVETKINFYLVGINDLDEVAQKLTTTGQFEVTWRDAFLSWIPSKKSDIVKMLVPQDDIWKPDIAMMNGFTTITQMGASFMFTLLDYNGTCVWRPYQIMTSTCHVDLTYFPYDIQECRLKFGTWASTDSDVKTEIGSAGLQIHEKFQENAEWKLIQTRTTNGTDNGNGVVIFTLTLKRTPSFVLLHIAIPVILLAFINVFTFALPLESGEKSGFSITVFLSFVVFLIIVSQKMPPNSDTISYFAAYVLGMTFLSGVTLMLSVVQLRMLTFTTLRYSIRPGVKRFVHIVHTIQRVFLCQKAEDKNKVEQLVAMEEIRQTLNRLYIPKRHKPMNQNEDNDDLIVSTPPPPDVTEEDDIKSVKSDVSSLKSIPRPTATAHNDARPGHSGEDNNSNQADDKKDAVNTDIDWMDVVNAFDFILFWLMLIVTTIMTAVYMMNISG